MTVPKSQVDDPARKGERFRLPYLPRQAEVWTPMAVGISGGALWLLFWLVPWLIGVSVVLDWAFTR
jgi:hypothetical protein